MDRSNKAKKGFSGDKTSFFCLRVYEKKLPSFFKTLAKLTNRNSPVLN